MRLSTLSTALAFLAAGLVTASPVPEAEGMAIAIDKRQTVTTQGLDIDYTTGSAVPWASLAPSYFFAFIQCTYGLTVTNTYWSSQKSGAVASGFLTGGVHHPNPAVSTAAVQARYFTANGGAWVADNKTFRGALYLGADKHNTANAYCYGLTNTAWIAWIKEFVTTYYTLNTNHYPLIFTSYDWWKQCTYGYTGFGSVDDMWYFGPTIPTGWTVYKFVQVSTAPTLWDVDNFNGNLAALSAYTA